MIRAARGRPISPASIWVPCGACYYNRDDLPDSGNGMGTMRESQENQRGLATGAWAALELTIEEGLKQLKTICSMQIRTADGGTCLRIPEPRATSQALLKALDLHLPEALPHADVPVVTRKKLPKQRKKH